MTEELTTQRLHDALSSTYDSGYRAALEMAIMFLEAYPVKEAIEKIHGKLNKEKLKNEQ